jgi:hypothetical protein
MKPLIKFLLISLVSWVVFSLVLFIGANLPREIVSWLLNLNISQYLTLIQNDFEFTRNYFANYPKIVFGLLFLSKQFYFCSILLLFASFGVIYSFKPSKKILFPILFYILSLITLDALIFIFESKSKIQFDKQIQAVALNQFNEVNELGINIFNENRSLKEDPNTEVNQAGFLAPFEFEKEVICAIKDTAAVLMFVGDSHTEGCCAVPLAHSFVNLVDKEEGWLSMNFGVGGTDMAQYYLVVKEYLEVVKPDLLIIALCDNDMKRFSRKANVEHSLYFNTTIGFLDARLPLSHPQYKYDTYFENWDVAKEYYIDSENILGSNPSIMKKIFLANNHLNSHIIRIFKIRKNALNTINSSRELEKLKAKASKPDYWTKLASIDSMARTINTPLLTVMIPSLFDKKNNNYEKYADFLAYFSIHYFENFESNLFISEENNHLTNEGHFKFANFLIPLIDSTLNYHALKNDSFVKE